MAKKLRQSPQPQLIDLKNGWRPKRVTTTQTNNSVSACAGNAETTCHSKNFGSLISDWLISGADAPAFICLVKKGIANTMLENKSRNTLPAHTTNAVGNPQLGSSHLKY